MARLLFIGLLLLAALWTPALAEDEFCGDVTPRELQEHAAQALNLESPACSPVPVCGDIPMPCKAQDHVAGELPCPDCGMKLGCCGVRMPSPLLPPGQSPVDCNLADGPERALEPPVDQRLGRQKMAAESPCPIDPPTPPVPPPR